jgi:hypothetical protein
MKRKKKKTKAEKLISPWGCNMRAINIANEKKRDAEVGFEALPKKPSIMMVLGSGGERKNVKFLKSTADLAALIKSSGNLVKTGEAILAGDPEVDMELVGKFISRTHKLYLTEDDKIAYRVNQMQVVHNPDGTEKEKRDLLKALANVTGEFPVQWTGRKFPKAEAVRKFVFTKKYQLRHTSGLTYDFLYDMAKTLHESESLMFVGGGPKGNEPIVLTAGGEQYRGFLEGRIDGDRYCLILHLTNMELKPLSQEQPEGGEAKGEEA